MNDPLSAVCFNPWEESEISSQVFEPCKLKLQDRDSVEGQLPLELAPVIYELKRKYKTLFWFPLRHINIIIRPLTRGEYFIYSQYIQQYGFEIDKWPLLQHCLLYPIKDSDQYVDLFSPKALAGWTDSIIGNILKITLFDNPEELQIIKDTYSGGIANGEFNLSTEWLLRGNLPGLTKEQVDDMTALEIMESISAVNHLTRGQVDFNLIVSDQERKRRDAAAMDAALRAATPVLNLK